jgi:hypothetical protein
MDDLFNLYRRCLDSNGLFRKISKDTKVDEYVTQLIIKQRELTSLYVTTASKNTLADKEVYEIETNDLQEAINRWGRWIEEKISESLVDGALIGIGYKSISDNALYAIPTREWVFLTIDYENSRAFCDERNYIGVRFISGLDLKKLPFKQADLIYSLFVNANSLLDAAVSDDELPDKVSALASGKRKAISESEKPIKTNDKRNKVAQEWITETNQTNLSLNSKTNVEILNELEAFRRTLKDENGNECYRPGLFGSGGNDWLNRDHSVIPKRTAGLRSGK